MNKIEESLVVKLEALGNEGYNNKKLYFFYITIQKSFFILKLRKFSLLILNYFIPKSYSIRVLIQSIKLKITVYER